MPNISLSFSEYQDQVLKYLEYLEYPEYIRDFDYTQVARAISGSTRAFWTYGESYRMCAIIIFSLTMNYQILPSVQDQVKH